MSHYKLVLAIVAISCSRGRSTPTIPRRPRANRRGLHDRPARGSEDPKSRRARRRSSTSPSSAVPTLTMDKFSISTTNKNQKVTMKPEKLRPTPATETIAIAIMIAGIQMIWIGSDEIPDIDDNSKYPGVLKDLEQAIMKLNLGNAGPPGSKGVVVSYSNWCRDQGPARRSQEHQRRRARRAGLQEQDRYRHDVGHRDGDGRAAESGRCAEAPVVGNDTNNEAAKPQLADMKKRAAAQGIRLVRDHLQGSDLERGRGHHHDDPEREEQ